MASSKTISIPCPISGVHPVMVESTGQHTWQVNIPGQNPISVALEQTAGPSGRALFRVGDTRMAVISTLTDNALYLWLNGRLLTLPREPKGPKRAGSSTATGAHGNAVVASMPGKIISVSAKTGEHVTAGDILVIMESMKMELSLSAPCNGTVHTVSATPGDTVDQGTVLVSIIETKDA